MTGRPVRLYNSLTRRIESLQPVSPRDVGIYTCGPTVYQYAHVGNLRSFLFADVLRRTLQYAGYSGPTETGSTAPLVADWSPYRSAAVPVKLPLGTDAWDDVRRPPTTTTTRRNWDEGCRP